VPDRGERHRLGQCEGYAEEAKVAPAPPAPRAPAAAQDQGRPLPKPAKALADYTDAEIAAEYFRLQQKAPKTDRKTYMRDYMRKRRMTA
jgi:hypothetical protein